MAGRVEVPSIICPKEMTLYDNVKLIPLAIKKIAT